MLHSFPLLWSALQLAGIFTFCASCCLVLAVCVLSISHFHSHSYSSFHLHSQSPASVW
jgi:hypothetical protein